MNKLQMVQNIILTEVRRVGVCSIDDEKLQEAWNIADKIQAEADKREKQNKDEFYANLADPMKKVREQEWQPDWSQAPDWAVAWTIDSAECLWWSYTPWFKNNFWFVDDSILWKCDDAPSFGYTGDWRNSLRKRPK